MYYTGILRDSYDILKTQDIKSKRMNKEMLINLDMIKEMGFNTKYILERAI